MKKIKRKKSSISLLRGVVILGVLLIGVFVTNFLLNKQQDVRQRASEINGVLFGVSPKSGNTLVSEASQFETDSGKNVAIINFWEEVDPAYPWGPYQANTLTAINSHHGAIPMMSWEPAPWGQNNVTTGSAYSLANFINGNYDSLIRSYAQGIKAYGKPMLVRWAHEMNGNWYSWGVGQKADGTTPNNNTATQYIDVWKRVKNIFATEGATNAQFVWCPSVNENGQRPFSQSFPGDDQIDWICLDGYNWNTPWLTFDQVFNASNTYNTITSLSQKPLMLGEFASNEAGDGGTKKAAWITNAFGTALPNYPRIKAVLWFNVFYDNANWPITSSAASKAAFAQSVASSYYLSSWDGVITQNSTPTQTQPTSTPIPTNAPISTPTPIITATKTPTPTITPIQSSDTTLPNISITYPSNNSYIKARKGINIQATASDNVKVTKVEFYVNGNLTCSDTTSNYTCGWKAPSNGGYVILAKAYDAAGNTSTSSVSVTAR